MNARRARKVVPCFVALVLFAAAPIARAERHVLQTNFDDESVAVYDIAANGALGGTAGSPFGGADSPTAVALTPDGSKAYVANFGSHSISAYGVAADGALTQIPGSFATGTGPMALAVTPDGRFLYVANRDAGTVSAFAIAANGGLASLGPNFAVETSPRSLAISPDGATMYVVNSGEGSMSILKISASGTLSQAPGSPIAVGLFPTYASIAPDGKHLFVADDIGNKIRAFDVAADGSLTIVPGSPFTATGGPQGLAVSPSGNRLYAPTSGNNAVLGYAIAASGALTPVPGSPFTVGPSGTTPYAVAILPDTTRLFVSNANGDSISSFTIAADGALGSVLGSPLVTPGGHENQSVAVTPDQPPVAAFTASPNGRQVSLDATTSSDPDGSIARFDWSFGDGAAAANAGASPTHLYGADGTYTVSLTLTDDEGCSTSRVFTGQTVSCNGGGGAVATRQVVIDTRLDGASLSAKAKQRQKGRKVLVKVKVGAGEPATATLGGEIKAGKKTFALRAMDAGLSGGDVTQLVLSPRKSKDSKRILALLADEVKVSATVDAAIEDGAGNQADEQVAVRLVP